MKEKLCEDFKNICEETKKCFARQIEIKDELKKYSPYKINDVVNVKFSVGIDLWDNADLKIYDIDVRLDGFFYKFYLPNKRINQSVFLPEKNIIKLIK